jgi:2-polyprenyl-6-methoxyphenol hydroxylase-like FAD-dependent oxidoreductase
MPYRVVVIGAGFGGIGMAIALKQAGIEDFVVVDRADDLGGTWRDNSYPGLTCDVPSHLGRAETAGHGRHQRGMTARRARRGLRVPTAVMRLGVRQLGRHCLDPALPWQAQRRRLDQLIPASLLPRGTTFTEQAIGGVRAEVVSARGSGSQRKVIHFHGGGYMEG